MIAMTPDPQTARVWKQQLPSTPKRVSRVRRLVGHALADWGYAGDDIDRALLVCGELTANAVQHARRRGRLFEVRITADGTDLLVEVSDASPDPPRPVAAGVDDEHGRGLQLVAALAEEMGHRLRDPLGKTVCARLLVSSPKAETDV